jgi:cold shock CspA family protein
MQATVSHFDATTGAGSVVYDNGEVAEFDPPAFARSGLRLLRPGQRVRVDVSDGEIVRLTIITLAYPPI